MSEIPPRPLTRPWLLMCILINQLATPGLGSLLARRFVAGAAQLLVAIAGFGLILVWMGWFFYGMGLRQIGEPSSEAPRWLWIWGSIVFGVSWLWALITSVGLWLQMNRLERSESDGLH